MWQWRPLLVTTSALSGSASDREAAGCQISGDWTNMRTDGGHQGRVTAHNVISRHWDTSADTGTRSSYSLNREKEYVSVDFLFSFWHVMLWYFALISKLLLTSQGMIRRRRWDDSSIQYKCQKKEQFSVPMWVLVSPVCHHVPRVALVFVYSAQCHHH